MTTSTSPDSRQHLTASDHALVTRHGAALHAANSTHLELPALLNQIRWHQRDGMAAIDRARTAWCWTHEQDLTACHHDDLDCGGEQVMTHGDPTGEAAIGHDQAAADGRELRRLIEHAITTQARIDTIADRYPSQPLPPPDIEATPGDDWCTSCWKDTRKGGHYCEPIGLKANGTVRYSGLCRWCGDFKANHGFEPTTALVHAKHDGERITPGMVDEAIEQHRKTHPPKPKGKVRGRRSKAARRGPAWSGADQD
jgi:hypothetical protein